LVIWAQTDKGNVMFQGRSTGWGCVYDVQGGYTGGGGGGGQRNRPNSWYSEFADNGPRIVLQINGPGTGSNVVLPGNNGGTLSVWVFGVAGTAPVTVSLSVDNTAVLTGLTPSIPVTPGSVTAATTGLNGGTSGSFLITASATINGQPISTTIAGVVQAWGIVITPDDNFNGRSLTKLGVGETGSLGATAGAPMPLTWARPTGTALSLTTIAPTTGTARFTAGDVYGQVTLTLSDQNNNSVTCNITVIPPSGVTYVQYPTNMTILHQQGLASCGFYGQASLQPTDVSFKNMSYGEDTCIAHTGGWYTNKNPKPAGLVHPADGPIPVGGGDINAGCVVTESDKATGVAVPPPNLAVGWFTWAIPQRYKVGTGAWHDIIVSGNTIFTFTHRVDLDATGKVTIQKGGVGPFSKNLNDATTTWP
jgi:hypothetical protein